MECGVEVEVEKRVDWNSFSRKVVVLMMMMML